MSIYFKWKDDERKPQKTKMNKSFGKLEMRVIWGKE